MGRTGRTLRIYDTSLLAQRQAALGWTNKRLAEIAGVHPATVGRVLKGETQSRDTVRKLAQVLGIDLADLVIPTESSRAKGRRRWTAPEEAAT